MFCETGLYDRHNCHIQTWCQAKDRSLIGQKGLNEIYITDMQAAGSTCRLSCSRNLRFPYLNRFAKWRRASWHSYKTSSLNVDGKENVIIVLAGIQTQYIRDKWRQLPIFRPTKPMTAARKKKKSRFSVRSWLRGPCHSVSSEMRGEQLAWSRGSRASPHPASHTTCPSSLCVSVRIGFNVNSVRSNIPPFLQRTNHHPKSTLLRTHPQDKNSQHVS